MNRAARGWLIVGIVVTIAGGCKKEEKNAFVPPPPPEVVVAPPVERDITKYFEYTGVVEASESVELRARVQGFLESIKFQPGQRVKKGDLLMVIDMRQFRAEMDKAEATIKAHEAALKGADNDAKLARELADQRAGPEIDAIIKAARRDAIAAEVLAAKAARQEAALNLEYCEIRAPIDGRITKNLVDVGNLVGRGDPTLLAKIVQAQPSYVSVDASESDVLEVRRKRLEHEDKNVEPGQSESGKWREVQLALADEREFGTTGRIDYVEPELNRETGTLRVRARFENENELLAPGLFARLRIPMDKFKGILVPEAALLSDQLGRFALVVNDKNEVEARRVKIGVLEGTMRVIQSGLTLSDRVVVSGVLKARPGAKVTPKSPPPEKDAAPAPAPASSSSKPASTKPAAH